MRICVLLCLAACGAPLASPEETASDLLQYPANASHAPVWSTSSSGVQYNGGLVLTDTPTLYLVYYGNVSTARQALMEDFATHLSGSPLANVLTTFFDSNGHSPSGKFNVTPVGPIAKIAGNQLTTAGIASIVQSLAPVNENAIYAIIGDADVGATTHKGTDFCSGPCGWHNVVTTGVTTTQYAFIGDPAHCRQLKPTTKACQFPYATGPNADPDGDHMVNVLWHETAEAVSDPNPSTGYRPEIGDFCEGSGFSEDGSHPPVGAVQLDIDYAAANGASCNTHLGSRDYLLQPIWQNIPGGGCVRRVLLERPSVGSDISGDLDGNHVPDLIFRNSSTGHVSTRLVDAAGTAGALTHLGSPARDYQIFGIADFNHDGKADILWRSLRTGRISVWIMNGTSHTSHELAAANAISLEWAIRGVGDFDGNGRADILFVHASDNQPRIWLNHSLTAFTINNTDTPKTSAHPASTSNVDTVGTGDFDGDGKADILWYRLDTNEYRLWTMNGATVSSAVTIDTSKLGRVLGIADANGDGKADLIGWSTNLQEVLWADTVGNTHNLLPFTTGGFTDSRWRYSGGSRVPAGGGALFWRNRSSGDLARWNVKADGTLAGVDVIVSAQSQNTQIASY